MATALKYPPLTKPIVPGHYFIAEQDEPIHMVQVCIEDDAHDLYYALLPEEDYKYHIGLWDGALWFGPVVKEDFGLFGQV